MIGIYIFNTPGRIIDLKQVGLHRDYGLIFFQDSYGPKTSKIQKEIIKAFKLLGFKIEIASKLKIVNFLDITFDLTNNTLKPFSKDNETPTYINVDSRHPRSIIKHLLNAVRMRINGLSSNKKIFKENRRYNDALEKSGVHHRLEYQNHLINNNFIEQCKTNKGSVSNENCSYTLGGGDNIIDTNRKIRHRKGNAI